MLQIDTPLAKISGYATDWEPIILENVDITVKMSLKVTVIFTTLYIVHMKMVVVILVVVVVVDVALVLVAVAVVVVLSFYRESYMLSTEVYD